MRAARWLGEAVGASASRLGLAVGVGVLISVAAPPDPVKGGAAGVDWLAAAVAGAVAEAVAGRHAEAKPTVGGVFPPPDA